MLSRAIERQKAVAASPPPTGRSRDKARESQREPERVGPPNVSSSSSPPSAPRAASPAIAAIISSAAPPAKSGSSSRGCAAQTHGRYRGGADACLRHVSRGRTSPNTREQTRKSAERAFQLDNFVCAAAIAARQTERGGSDGVQQERRRDRKAYLLSSPERGLPGGRRRSPGASTQPAEHRRSLCLSSTCCF